MRCKQVVDVATKAGKSIRKDVQKAILNGELLVIKKPVGDADVLKHIESVLDKGICSRTGCKTATVVTKQGRTLRIAYNGKYVDETGAPAAFCRVKAGPTIPPEKYPAARRMAAKIINALVD